MSKRTKKILLLFAHPALRRSEVNALLYKAAQSLDFVTCVDLYEEYPTYDIDIEIEQERLKEHDIVVFQFPLYWYSTPSILKEWQDLVLEYGFAYGNGGNALHGKQFLTCISAGGLKEAYQTDGYNHFTIRELLHPLEQTAQLTGMDYLPPYILFGARTAKEEQRVQPHIEGWKTLLTDLHKDNIDLALARRIPKLNVLVTTPEDE
ncbi:NAD(P)H-dependent oxidoreductase [Vibrio sp.]|nr:NAD(P)H-dependent oxidoreductase [Vibrio sp.]